MKTKEEELQELILSYESSNAILEDKRIYEEDMFK